MSEESLTEQPKERLSFEVIEELKYVKTPLAIAGTIDGVKKDITRVLVKYDKDMGLSAEESLASLWDKAWEVQDANDFVNNNLRQIQVMIEDLYRGMLEGRGEQEGRMKFLRKEMKDIGGEEREKVLKMMLDEEKRFTVVQIEQMKMINNLVKTSRELANEIRQSAMARKFNVHISDVKKMAIAFRAVLHNRITDINLLCRISEELDLVMKKIFPIQANGDY